ncbi:MAG: lipoprotein-releasing ABC transporter permease subunit [Gammaproteobacteria bacterium]|nr:lipoprotein-releasing ABC transporter permease subunit [Gammaproteobacteria bacterium]
MYNPLPIFIGLRYMRAKKKNHFVSFISLSSMLGIGIGVTVLITVLSVMNGFHDQIYKSFFGMAPEITVSGQTAPIEDWQAVSKQLDKTEEIKASAPFVEEMGLLKFDGQVAPVMINGILPEKEQTVNHLKDKLLIGSMDHLPHFGMIVGRALAEKLGVMMGDKVTVVIPEVSTTPAGSLPRFKRFTIVGVFSAGSGFGFDKNLAFIHINDAQKLMQLGQGVTGIKLKIDSIYRAPLLSEQLYDQLGEQYLVSNWTQQYGAFFQAVSMERNMMFFVLVLIIAVAAFNLVSSLVMIVNDKQAEIAILRTIGASPRLILAVFVVQGMMVGCVGTLMGLVGGLALASNAPAIIHYLQQMFHFSLFAFNLYGTDLLPIKILWTDLWQVCGVAMFLSFLATIYPARRASKTIIAEALHYE